VTAVAAVPADHDPIAGLPPDDLLAHRVDDARDLMPRNSRVLDSREESVFGEEVAVTDSAGLDLDPDLLEARLRHLSFDQLERSVRVPDLNGAHRCHSFSL
jgi:hypothetical protein